MPEPAFGAAAQRTYLQEMEAQRVTSTTRGFRLKRGQQNAKILLYNNLRTLKRF